MLIDNRVVLELDGKEVIGEVTILECKRYIIFGVKYDGLRQTHKLLNLSVAERMGDIMLKDIYFAIKSIELNKEFLREQLNIFDASIKYVYDTMFNHDKFCSSRRALKKQLKEGMIDSKEYQYELEELKKSYTEYKWGKYGVYDRFLFNLKIIGISYNYGYSIVDVIRKKVQV